jgi:hypothetical protein
MTFKFKSGYSQHDAFYARVELLRPQYGNWDCEDPVAHAILDVIEAQSVLNELFTDDAEHGSASKAAFRAVLKKRHTAGQKLMAALIDEHRWPHDYPIHWE